VTRLELLEEVYRRIPPDQIKRYLFDQMSRVAARFDDLGVTRLYPLLRLDGAR